MYPSNTFNAFHVISTDVSLANENIILVADIEFQDCKKKYGSHLYRVVNNAKS